MPPRITAVTNQKGGVGKSTTAEALAGGLYLKHFKTLLIDLDPQGSVSLTSRVSPDAPTAYDLLTGKSSVEEVIQRRENSPDIIPSGRSLSSLDIELSAIGKEYKLRDMISPVFSRYDHIVIDTPPALGILTINALTACTGIIIPTQADVYSLQGIGQLFDTIKAVKTYTNPNASISGILITRYNGRNVLTRDMTKAINAAADGIGTFVYKSAIRECVAVREAQALSQGIFEYAKKSNAGADYSAFVEEFIKRSKNQ